MKQDRHAVSRRLHVCLDVSVSKLHSFGESGPRVFFAAQVSATVGKG
jgi:hypothetical protein